MTRKPDIEPASKARLVKMTPAWARQLLAKNTGNRNVSKLAVERLSRDMMSGMFRFNGDAIRVRDSGQLADGQHRLLACIEADHSFETILVEGLDQEDMLTLDRGRKRTIGDNLTIAYNFPNGNQLAAACRMLTVLAERKFRTSVTAKECVNILTAHPGLQVSNRRIRRVTPASHSGICAIHYIGSHIQGLEDRADAFARVFRTGAPDYDGDPAHLLREKLWTDRSSRARMSPRQHLATLTYVWAAFVRYEKVRLLRPWTELVMQEWGPEDLLRPTPALDLDKDHIRLQPRFNFGR